MSVTLLAVSEDEAEIRLDRWLRRHFSLTQGVIEKLCRTGRVRVDGQRATPSARLAAGQSVQIPPLPAGPPPPPAAVPVVDARLLRDLEAMVLWRDSQLIVLNKPSGLASQGGPGIRRHLDGMLEAWRAEGERPRLVHRLDRDTSGVIVVARTAGVAAKLAAAFRGRDVEKTYWAVVVGRPVPVTGRIDLPLSRARTLQAGRITVAEPEAEESVRAVTEYRTLDHAARQLAWLELRPLTGRTHQLRVHCAAIGAPILGDVAYGAKRGPADPERAGQNTALVTGLDTRLHLHARRLSLPHPAGGTLVVEAPLPPHMRATFRALGFTVPPQQPPRRG